MISNKPISIYAEQVEPDALEQFNSAMEMDFAVKGALMPDVHTGYSLPIGAVVATKGVIVPSWVGYDIGCGMGAIKLLLKRADIEPFKEKIFNEINHSIPIGKGRMQFKEQYSAVLSILDKTDRAKEILTKKKWLYQLGTLGSGNHFIEIAYDEADFVWIVVHSGSRAVGHGIAEAYMKLASNSNKAKEGHYALRIDEQDGQDYIIDLDFCLYYAKTNRGLMMGEIIKIIGRVLNERSTLMKWESRINRNHNHAEEVDNETSDGGLWIHRKGATHAEKGMMGVIPGNMRDGSFIVKGKGNPDSLYSSSHGAGRVLSRKQARNTLNANEYIEMMKENNIVSSANKSNVDESPKAYKNIFDVMDMQKDLITIVTHLTPMINVKG